MRLLRRANALLATTGGVRLSLQRNPSAVLFSSLLTSHFFVFLVLLYVTVAKFLRARVKHIASQEDFSYLTYYCRLKRKRALLGSNPPRNRPAEAHPSDRAGAGTAIPAPQPLTTTLSTDRLPYALKTHRLKYLCFPN